ncbi:MAG: NADPH:quinone reductase-like Zn-dependent oxidoreductase [Cryomorphaceae bacterium]|jgi:NADPH:quinone reductase-like Zn-dependent oxidoreductase
MKAVVFDKYGSIDNLRMEEIEKPEPKADEVRLKVYAASVNSGDLQLINGRLSSRLRTGIFRPGRTVPGIDVSGIVDAMGPEAIGCTWGQEVYADLSDYGFGGFAEYVCVPKSAIALKPSNLSYVEAAAVPMAATTALQGLLTWGEMLSYRSALVIGAAGGVGHFAVQIAKNFNLQVTAVTREQNLDFVTSLGADYVMSYDEIDFSSDKHYELIFDTVADNSAHKYRKMLTRDGKYVACAFSPSAVLHSPFGGILNNRKIVTFEAQPSMDDLAIIRKMIEKGNVTPKVDRIYTLEETGEALKYLAAGNARGKVVIKIAG